MSKTSPNKLRTSVWMHKDHHAALLFLAGETGAPVAWHLHQALNGHLHMDVPFRTKRAEMNEEVVDGSAEDSGN